MRIRFVILCVVGLLLQGCASLPYPPCDLSIDRHRITATNEPQFVRGRTNVVVDSIGWVVGIPVKVLLLDRRMENHRIDPAVEESLKAYLAFNQLDDIKVRINQYAPGAEFMRLTRNKNVGAGWRYTTGMLAWLYYTILPGRIFGGDSYNPYTDTISLYSNIRAVAIHEGGHGKDFRQRTYPGTYAFAYLLPFVALYPEALASSDAMSYLTTQRPVEEEKEGYRILYPAYGTYVGGSLAGGLGPLSPVYYVGLVAGHVIGRCQAGQVEEDRRWRSGQQP